MIGDILSDAVNRIRKDWLSDKQMYPQGPLRDRIEAVVSEMDAVRRDIDKASVQTPT